MSIRIYKAKRNKKGCSVTVNGEPLPMAEPDEECRYNFPVAREFSWGDDSDASWYLAFCILHDFKPDYAQALYPALHQDFIRQIKDDEWQVTNEELDEGIAFWCETMRLNPREPIVIPPFIYRVFIKSSNLPGATIKPEQVREALKKLDQMPYASELQSVVNEDPPN